MIRKLVAEYESDYIVLNISYINIRGVVRLETIVYNGTDISNIRSSCQSFSDFIYSSECVRLFENLKQLYNSSKCIIKATYELDAENKLFEDLNRYIENLKD